MTRRSLALLVGLLVLAAACGQSSDPFGSTTSASGAELDSEGGRLDLSGGVVVEAVAGTFAGPAAFTVGPAADASLPEGAIAVGEPIALMSSLEPAVPVVVGLPLPDGASGENLVVLRTDDDGQTQLLGGWVEGGTLFAATPGFSRFQIVDYQIGRVLEGLPAAVPLYPPRFGPAIESSDPGFREEWILLSQGEIDRPAARLVRVVGPGEVTVGQTTAFTAAYFDSIAGPLVEYSWSLYGDGLAITAELEGGGVLVEGTGEGRAVLTVEATDPATGAQAFGSRRVFTVAETSLTIVALPQRALCYYLSHEPAVITTAVGGTPPYRWSWRWSDGESGAQEADGLTITHGRIKRDIALTIGVVDAAGVEAEAAVAIRGLPGESTTAIALLAGPFSGEVGEELTFRIVSQNPDYAYNLPLQVRLGGAAGTVAAEGDAARVTFLEPGWGLVELVDNVFGVALQDQDGIWTSLVKVTGEAPPARARIANLPERIDAGVPAEFRLQVRGGVVAGLVPPGTYTGEVDFDDGAVEPIEIEASSALEWSGVRVRHTWVESGTYTVTFIVTTPDGQTAEATAEVEVRGEQRAVGKFQVAEVEGLEILANRVVLLISGEQLTIDKLEFSSTYRVTDLGGNPTGCAQDAEIFLVASGLTLDPGAGSIGGTVTIRDTGAFIGGEACPFGGGTPRDVTREGQATGTFRDGMLELRLSFPAVAGAAESTYLLQATVR